MVLGCDREVWATHRAAVLAKAVERLWGGHLVDEVKVDVQKVGLALFTMDDVLVPDLLTQSFRFTAHGVRGYRATSRFCPNGRGSTQLSVTAMSRSSPPRKTVSVTS